LNGRGNLPLGFLSMTERRDDGDHRCMEDRPVDNAALIIGRNKRRNPAYRLVFHVILG